MNEMAQLAAWFHWPLGTLLDLEHHDREHFLDIIMSASPAPSTVEG